MAGRNQPFENSPVVVGVNGRDEGRDALAAADALAAGLGRPLLVVCTYPSLLSPSAVAAAELRARAEAVLADAIAEVRDDTRVVARALVADSPARALHELAESEHPAALVVGSTHRGPVGRVLAGSVAQPLLAGSPCPVVVAPRGLAGRGRISIRSVGVGFDDSPESWNALQRAAALAEAAGAGLRLVFALEPLGALPVAPTAVEEVLLERRRQAEIAVERAVASVASVIDIRAELALGRAVSVLEKEARDLDLLVLGSRGYGALQRVFLGSLSSHLMRHAGCPVMVVPRSVDFDPGPDGLAAHDERPSDKRGAGP